ncbi:MAG: HAD-IC family P-type ATPase [Gammaproteobacteria bacterium]|nr:HAD-IC family P-type ATPase [Gammaproteobacteria bacterium]
MNKHQFQGLSSTEAAKRLAHYGANILPERKAPGLVYVFFTQFKSPFIYVLLVAAIISFALDHTVNAFFIIAVLLINALIGTIQEYSAEKSAAALKKMVPSFTNVIRDGSVIQIHTRDVVPGDIVQLASGDKVPADLKLSWTHELQVDESLLTGESIATEKNISQSIQEPLPITEQHDTCFAGTVVMRGRGIGEVTATADNTQIGLIASDVGQSQSTLPLLQRIHHFTLGITYSILILIGIIFLITLLRGDDFATIFLLGVALAVSAIPEGLPAAITIALAIGMSRMAKNNVIIRKLLAVEALGSCTYIASDKTGTLTVNEMTIQHIWLSDNTNYSISGEGMDLHGAISAIDHSNNQTALELLCHAGILANESDLVQKDNHWTAQGDAVDVAFLVLAEKNGIAYSEIRSLYPELEKIPYESEHAFSASFNRYKGDLYVFVKGSVEKLLTLCNKNINASDFDSELINQQSRHLAKQGYRVLALACTKLDTLPAVPLDALHKLTFIGMAGIIDPLRAEVIEAVQQCKDASIKVAMITGDHPETALTLAKQAGIADDDMTAVTGQELELARQSDPGTYQQIINQTRVFARVAPHQKKQIVEQLIDNGEFVAVTGDGVNDAPALSQAHVGVAMGLRGTDVARESADLIIADDHFASIVQGIKQGRIVYNNIRKVIFLLISTGAAEIILVMLSLLFSTPLPLLPIQLLWLNLVTNGIQDVALAFEPEEGNELKRKPREPREPVFNRLMIERVLINAFAMGCIAFLVFKWQYDQGIAEEQARNITLLLMVLFENVHVLNCRSETQSIFKQYFLGNKFLIFGMLAAQTIHILAMYTPGVREILQLEAVSIHQWLNLLGIALILLIINEAYKLYHNYLSGKYRY